MLTRPYIGLAASASLESCVLLMPNVFRSMLGIGAYAKAIFSKGAGAENHLPKQISQVTQIFTEQSIKTFLKRSLHVDF